MYGRPFDVLGLGGIRKVYKQQTIRRVERKVGRNEACPCGSGKKYKKCCIGKRVYIYGGGERR